MGSQVGGWTGCVELPCAELTPKLRTCLSSPPAPACNADAVLCSCHCWCRGRQVALDIAEALDYLHTELQVAHGDLKPG